MTPVGLITVIFGAMAAFWLFVWFGELVARSPKMFYYGKFRKFFK